MQPVASPAACAAGHSCCSAVTCVVSSNILVSSSCTFFPARKRSGVRNKENAGDPAHRCAHFPVPFTASSLRHNLCPFELAVHQVELLDLQQKRDKNSDKKSGSYKNICARAVKRTKSGRAGAEAPKRPRPTRRGSGKLFCLYPAALPALDLSEPGSPFRPTELSTLQRHPCPLKSK